MRLELIEGIRILIIAFLTYIPTVTFSGWFTAWVAKKCGDDVPEQLGFLTLDPFMHFSVFGFIFLLIAELFGNYLTFFKGFPGFGRFIILDPAPTTSKFKVALEFFARSIAHFFLLIMSVVFFTLLFKSALLYPTSIWTEQISSLTHALSDILRFFQEQNYILFVIYFLMGLTDTICFLFNIPRFLSIIYFFILVGNFVVLGNYVELLLHYILVAVMTLVTKCMV